MLQSLHSICGDRRSINLLSLVNNVVGFLNMNHSPGVNSIDPKVEIYKQTARLIEETLNRVLGLVEYKMCTHKI